MTKDVLVKISGLQFAEDQDNGPVEIITTGNYYKKNGKHYILYDEVQEGFDGVTKSVIKVNDDFLDVTKKGVTNVHMMFEKNKKNMSYYNTPFGNLLVGINATDVKVNETEDNIDIKVDYKLEVNYEHLVRQHFFILHLARLKSREPSKYPCLQPLQVFSNSRQVPQ